LLFVLCTFLFFSCSPEKNDNQNVSSGGSVPVYGDAYITANLSDSSYLNPILASDSASGAANGQLFNGLLKYDKDLQVACDLAESYDVSKDGLEITFKLRKDVKWHDGQPFTARDVKYTYEALTDPNTRTPYSSNFTIIKKFKIVDDYTVKVYYDAPFAPNLQSWMMPVLPEHIFRGQDINNASANRNPVGTGPYKFKSWQTDQKITLTSNGGYFKGRPYINRYIVQVVPDQAVQFLELRNESLDSVGLSPDQWNAYESFFEKYDKYRYPSHAFTYMGFNMSMEPFGDKNFRKAMQYAVNKKDIIDGVLLGTGKEAAGPYPPHVWAHNPNLKMSEYDPQKAAEILKELGFEDVNKDGLLEYKGKRFEFTITTNQGNKQRELTAQIVQEQLKKIGIKANIRIIEFSTFVNQYIAKREFEAIIMGWSLALDPDQYSLWHSKETGPRQYNMLGYSNPRVDEILIEARSTFDTDKRRKLYYEMQEIMAEDIPCIFLYYPETLLALHKRFKGVELAPIGVGHNFEEWWVPQALQRYAFSDK
jgi:peptide/nickel transport system substrate-binding protein